MNSPSLPFAGFLFAALALVAADELTSPSVVAVKDARAVIIEEGDTLDLKVAGEQDFCMSEALVEKGGKLLHPILGEIEIAGLTVKAAEGKIHKLLAEDYLTKPIVSLRIAKFAEYSFTVAGEVREPGTYSVPRNRELDAAQAVMRYGKGPTRLGSAKATVERTENGEKVILKVNLGDAKARRVILRHGDVIRVGEKLF